MKPRDVSLLESKDKINWYNWLNIYKNPNAIHLLKKKIEQINWALLSKNASIFEPDYQSMSMDRTKLIYQELMEQVWHPSRIIKWIEADFDF
jgi:hypothetical protein